MDEANTAWTLVEHFKGRADAQEKVVGIALTNVAMMQWVRDCPEDYSRSGLPLPIVRVKASI